MEEILHQLIGSLSHWKVGCLDGKILPLKSRQTFVEALEIHREKIPFPDSMSKNDDWVWVQTPYIGDGSSSHL